MKYYALFLLLLLPCFAEKSYAQSLYDKQRRVIATKINNNFRINPHFLKTAISKVERDKIVTRGYNQRDLIEKIRYSDMVFLLLKSRLPSIKEGKIFNKVLVSFCDHGATPPSTQTARLVASSASPMNSAVAGVLLSFGHKHAGVIEIGRASCRERV